ncbi:MAG: EutN/CcmL family microcompartment protein [Candidatus Riflebacteria bacterium]|jgi:ethanolamine utilization protein EutN|nr:EutN/CcmL family microcompartment protein [Candidatus Riflebacteria bacterium]
MYLGRVLGRAVCTAKDPTLKGLKLIIVTRIDGNGNAKGKPFIACDSIGAGQGETVFLCGGGEAAFPFVKTRPPSDASILGVIDNIKG